MNPDPNKLYLIGPEEDLRALFPNYKGNDERTLPDGSFLIEVNCTPDELAAIGKSKTVKAFSHEEVIQHLRQFDQKESLPIDQETE